MFIILIVHAMPALAPMAACSFSFFFLSFLLTGWVSKLSSSVVTVFIIHSSHCYQGHCTYRSTFFILFANWLGNQAVFLLHHHQCHPPPNLEAFLSNHHHHHHHHLLLLLCHLFSSGVLALLMYLSF